MELKVTKRVVKGKDGKDVTTYEVKQYVDVQDINGNTVKVSFAPSQTLTETQYAQALTQKQTEVSDMTSAKSVADAEYAAKVG